MAMITYDNKSTLNPQPSVADANKVTSNDMNEIKSVVNTNYGEVGNITNLNTTDKTSIVSAINELKDAEVYSTSEVKTNKIWIDNKPIYRIVYQVSNLVAGNNYFGDTTGIEEYINGYGIIHRSNGNHYFISSYQTTNAFVAIGMDNSTYHKFNLVIGNGVSDITDAYVVIEYTKFS